MIYLVSSKKNIFSSFKNITLDEAINLLNRLNEIGSDTETTGLDCHINKLLCIQLGNKEFQIVFDLENTNGLIPDKLKNFLINYKGIFIFQNAKFDLKFLYKQHILLQNVYDTLLGEQIITHGLQFGGRDLDTLVKKYLPDEKCLDKSIRDKIVRTKRLDNDSIEYAAMDVKYLSEIKNKQLKRAADLDLLKAIELDNLFVKVLAYVEFCGMKLNWSKWREKSLKEIEERNRRKEILDDWIIAKGLTQYTDNTVDLFSNKVKCTINWESSKQVIPLFESFGINCTIIEKGEKKKSIDAKKVLALQRNDFEILPLYLDYKDTVTLTTTFGLNWEKYINPNTGRVYSIFRQIQSTGRMSSGEKASKSNPVGYPNFQNLPAGKDTRSCFIAEKGNKIAAIDYSSQEQRILANFSKVDTLLNFYAKGFTDMHSYVAFLMYPEIRRCSLEDLTNEDLIYIKNNYKHNRDLAKNAGFAINYGGNGSTISKNCGISKKQGDYVYNAYFEAFAGLKEYFAYVLEKTKKNGYIVFNNVTRRKFFFPSNNSVLIYKDFIGTDDMYQFSNPKQVEREYNKALGEMARLAQNYPIQGSASDMTKLACVIFYNTIIKKGWMWKVKMINIVHDEILIEASESIIDEATDLLKKSMEKAGDLFCKIIPLTADPAIGDYWIH